MKPTRIAFLLYDFWQGGICTSYINLCRELHRVHPDEYDFFFLASDYGKFHPEIEKLGHCEYVGPKVIRMTEKLMEIRPHIAQVACKNEYIKSCQEIKKRGIFLKIIERVDGRRSALRIDKKFVDAYVCHSFGVQTEIWDHYDRTDWVMNKSVMIRNGVPIPHISECVMERSDPIIGRMARLGKGKGLDQMIFSAVRNPVRRKYVIIGSNSKLRGSEQEKERLENMILMSGANNIEIINEIHDPEQKRKWLLRFSVAVCTSLPENEGMSNFLIEAMSYGIPIVSTNVGDHKEFFLDPINKPGLMYQGDGFDEALDTVIDGWGDYHYAAYRLAQKMFDVQHTAAQYNELYQRIL